MTARTLAGLLVLSLSACGGAPAEVGKVVAEVREEISIDAERSAAWKLYESGNHAAFVLAMEGVYAKSHLDIDLYNLACGYALAGDKEKALAALATVAERGQDFGMQDDSDLDALRSDPRFAEIAAKAAMHEKAREYLEPYREMAMERYRAGEYREFTAMMEKITQYSAADVDLYNLACGYALTGRTDEAIATYERLVDRGADFGAADDSDFDSVRADPRFQALLVRVAAL